MLLSLHPSFVLLPHVLKSIFYVYVFIPALQLGSSVHFFIYIFHMYVLAYGICFSLSDLLHSVWQTLGLSTSLQITQFRFFLWLSNIPLYICCAPSSLFIHLAGGFLTTVPPGKTPPILLHKVKYTQAAPILKQSIYPLETWKSSKDNVLIHKIIQAHPHRFTYSFITLWDSTSCANSPVTPLLKNAQDSSLPTKHSKHNFSYIHFPGSPKHSSCLMPLRTLLFPQQERCLHHSQHSPHLHLYMSIIRSLQCLDTMRGPCT